MSFFRSQKMIVDILAVQFAQSRALLQRRLDDMWAAFNCLYGFCIVSFLTLDHSWSAALLFAGSINAAALATAFMVNARTVAVLPAWSTRDPRYAVVRVLTCARSKGSLVPAAMIVNMTMCT